MYQDVYSLIFAQGASIKDVPYKKDILDPLPFRRPSSHPKGHTIIFYLILYGLVF